jgi:hypothetical protein
LANNSRPTAQCPRRLDGPPSRKWISIFIGYRVASGSIRTLGLWRVGRCEVSRLHPFCRAQPVGTGFRTARGRRFFRIPRRICPRHG